MILTGLIIFVGGIFLEAILPKNKIYGMFHWFTLILGIGFILAGLLK